MRTTLHGTQTKAPKYRPVATSEQTTHSLFIFSCPCLCMCPDVWMTACVLVDILGVLGVAKSLGAIVRMLLLSLLLLVVLVVLFSNFKTNELLFVELKRLECCCCCCCFCCCCSCDKCCCKNCCCCKFCCGVFCCCCGCCCCCWRLFSSICFSLNSC